MVERISSSDAILEFAYPTRSAAYRRIEAGQIEAFKLGERWFVPTAPLKRKLGL
jgi:hypothetical protein